MQYTFTHNEKTHTIEMKMEGTVGIALIADSLMNGGTKMVDTPVKVKDEKGNEIEKVMPLPTERYQCALLYAVAMSSSRGLEKDVDFFAFMLSMSHKDYKELSEWFWKRWNEIEGIFAPDQEEEGGDGKKKV